MSNSAAGKFLGLVLSITVSIGWTVTTQAQVSSSDGCQLLNSAARDGLYASYGGGGTAVQFFAGDLVQINAGNPSDFGSATSTSLFVSGPNEDFVDFDNGTPVDTDIFPGSLSYEFPADITTVVGWKVDQDNVTWTVSCVSSEVSTPPATAVPTMPAYGLVLTMLGLLVVVSRRLRASAKRK